MDIPNIYKTPKMKEEYIKKLHKNASKFKDPYNETDWGNFFEVEAEMDDDSGEENDILDMEVEI